METPNISPAITPEVSPPINYELYDFRGVSIATVLGSPAAGSVLLAMNYRRLGRSGEAVASVVLGILGTLAIMVLAYLLPTKTPSVLFWLPPIYVMTLLSKSLQGPAIAAHTSAGGRLASRWKAAGVGVIGLAIIGSALLFYVYGPFNPLGSKIVIGMKDEMYYRGTATVEDAKSLGAALKTDGFFTDKGVTVALSKGAEGTRVSFVVNEGVWDNAAMIKGFETLGREIAPSVGGLPITIRLMNAETTVKKEFKISP